MQGHDWNDLKVVLALDRAGTLAGAARALGTSDTTVSRRLKALEADLGLVLFARTASGRYRSTDAGTRILRDAEAAEHANARIRDIAGRVGNSLAGTVRVSSVPVIVNHVLVPRLPDFWCRHPGTAVELVPETRNLDLTRREADLAIRFARPVTGGLRIGARKLGALTFGVFGPVAADDGTARPLPWITYDDANDGLPQARWLTSQAARTPAARAPLRVSDLQTAQAAAAAGLGRTLLPEIVGRADARLRALPAGDAPPLPARDVWLLGHVDQQERASVSAFKNWLGGLSWR